MPNLNAEILTLHEPASVIVVTGPGWFSQMSKEQLSAVKASGETVNSVAWAPRPSR
jgi:hypothetical protein